MIIELLRAACPDVATDPDILHSYARDKADLCSAERALALARPTTTEQVAALLAVAAEHRLPVVPQGARTGLSGAANAIHDCLLISLTGMDSIIEIDAANRLAVVQAGVTNGELSHRVAEHNLWYPPDPSSWESSTIGGNVATNAGGMCCVKYGVTGEYVLGLTVVLAGGEVLRCGRRTAKGVAGYDLTRLFVGSEGTLGVITEVTVRLRPPPPPALTLVAEFESLTAAGAAVAAITAAGLTPTVLELLDNVNLRAIEAYRPIGLDTRSAALLLITDEINTVPEPTAPEPTAPTSDGVDNGLGALARCCRQAGASEIYTATNAVEADALMAARRLTQPAMEALAHRMFPHGQPAVITDDVAVPRTRLVELINGASAVAKRHGLTLGLAGHAGDGNLHPKLLLDLADQASVAAGMVASDDIVALAIGLGGTCTGEHGVGLLKRDWLARELGGTSMRVHRAIKQALDPSNILNPGKVLPAAH